MTGKKKNMDGAGYQERELKELDEYYSLLTKTDQGMINRLRFESRLKNFYKLLNKILSNHYISIIYQKYGIDKKLSVLLELWGKFKSIKSIKNSGSKNIVQLFQANIVNMAQEVKNILLRSLEDIIRKINDKRERKTYSGIDIEISELEFIEKNLDFFIGLINLSSTTFSNNKNINFNILQQSFNIILQQYLIYISELSSYVMQLDLQNSIRQKYDQIKSKRNFANNNSYENRSAKLKSKIQTKKQEYIKQTKQNNPNQHGLSLNNINYTIEQHNQNPPIKYYSTNLDKFIQNNSEENYSLMEETERLSSLNRNQKNANYDIIYKELYNKYKNNNNFDRTKLTTLASIGASLLSIKRMTNGSNKKILVNALIDIMIEKSKSLSIYAEFKQYIDSLIYQLKNSENNKLILLKNLSQQL